MPNRVVHFEVEAENSQRARKFYADAFGWKMSDMPGDTTGYVVVNTGDEPMGINGGIFQASGKKQMNAYSCVIGVDDIYQAMKDVEAAGGKVTSKDKKPMDIPHVGLYASCEDTEGNRFTLLQPSSDMAPQKP